MKLCQKRWSNIPNIHMKHHLVTMTLKQSQRSILDTKYKQNLS